MYFSVLLVMCLVDAYCRLPTIQQEVQQRKLLYMGLYLLIWGEAANLRFMPECLCYIYHHVCFVTWTNLCLFAFPRMLRVIFVVSHCRIFRDVLMHFQHLQWKANFGYTMTYMNPLPNFLYPLMCLLPFIPNLLTWKNWITHILYFYAS